MLLGQGTRREAEQRTAIYPAAERRRIERALNFVGTADGASRREHENSSQRSLERKFPIRHSPFFIFHFSLDIRSSFSRASILASVSTSSSLTNSPPRALLTSAAVMKA